MPKALSESKTSAVFSPARATTFFEIGDPLVLRCAFRAGRHLLDPAWSYRTHAALAYFMHGTVPYLYLSYNTLGNSIDPVIHANLLRHYEPTIFPHAWLSMSVPLSLSFRSRGYSLSCTLAPSLLEALWSHVGTPSTSGAWLARRLAPGRWGAAYRVHSRSHHLLYIALSTARP